MFSALLLMKPLNFLLFAGDHLFRDLCVWPVGMWVLQWWLCWWRSIQSFLHLRQVLCMASLAKSTFYRVNSMIKPGHLCSVSHQHSGLDDPLAGAESWPHPPDQLHHRQRGSGHNDRHEHCVVCRLMRVTSWSPAVRRRWGKRRRKKCRKRTLPTPAFSSNQIRSHRHHSQTLGKSSFQPADFIPEHLIVD